MHILKLIIIINLYFTIIGFPVTLREYRSNYYKNGFVLYKINLENNEFEKYGEIFQKTDYRTNINRAIYINDKFYTLANYQIVLYDFNSFEKIKDLELE